MGECLNAAASTFVSFVALPQRGSGEGATFKLACEIELRADKSADGEAQDKEHGELALHHIGKRGISTKHEAAKPKRIKECLLVFLPDAGAHQGPKDTANNDGTGIDDCA